jgi:hypothetical protein
MPCSNSLLAHFVHGKLTCCRRALVHGLAVTLYPLDICPVGLDEFEAYTTDRFRSHCVRSRGFHFAADGCDALDDRFVEFSDDLLCSALQLLKRRFRAVLFRNPPKPRFRLGPDFSEIIGRIRTYQM